MLTGNIPGVTETMSTAIYTASETGDMTTATLLIGIMLAFGLEATFIARVFSEKRTARHAGFRRK